MCGFCCANVLCQEQFRETGRALRRMNDIVVNKIQSMQRCIARVREEYEFAGGNLASDITHQDAAVLDIMRACEVGDRLGRPI